jgi:hydrogenase nickel incorporation protein HypB
MITITSVTHDHGHDHDHGMADHHHEPAFAAIDFGKGLAGVSVPGLSQERTISIERDILAKNDAFADANRSRLRELGFSPSISCRALAPGRHRSSCARSRISRIAGRWR